MDKKDIAQLSVALAAGLITEDMISEELGDSFLADVIAFSGASVAGNIASDIVGGIMDNEIVDDVTSTLTFGLFD